MNKKISISIAHNRKIKSSFLLGNNEAKSNEKKNPTMLESQERNFLAQKCKVKYNSFISGKSFHKTIMNNNSKDSYMNLVKSQKKYNLNNSKKELIYLILVVLIYQLILMEVIQMDKSVSFHI